MRLAFPSINTKLARVGGCRFGQLIKKFGALGRLDPRWPARHRLLTPLTARRRGVTRVTRSVTRCT